MTRLVVIGAGVAGLAAAWEATQRGAFDEIVVLEAAPRTGGKLLTTEVALPDGTSLLIDEGADAFLARRPEAVQLCEELGLTNELTSPSVGRAKVFVEGALQFLPARTALGVPLDVHDPEVAAVLGPAGVAELVAADGADHAPLSGDVPIGPYLRARLGPTTVERIVGPLLGGINAGDIDHMSLQAVAPPIAAAAAAGGSLAAAATRNVVPAEGPVFLTPLGGSQRLVDRLVEAIVELRVDVRTSTPVGALAMDGAQVCVATPDDELTADAVVVATPAHVAAGLLVELSPSAADLLGGIDHVSVAFLTLVFNRTDVPGPLDAAGMLVPHSSATTITAASWGSVKWAHWDDGHHVVIRASIGHDGDDRGRTLNDEQITSTVLNDLHSTMGITASPVAVRITRWPDAFPQYRPGHGDLVERVTLQLADDAPQVRLAGMAYDGVGIPASIGTGRRAAAALSEMLA